MYFAEIGQFSRDGSEPRNDDGFVILTTDSDQGMVDIHDRRPVVLSLKFAAEWINPELSTIVAEEILKKRGEPVTKFEWYPVGREVGSVRNEGAGLLKPI